MVGRLQFCFLLWPDSATPVIDRRNIPFSISDVTEPCAEVRNVFYFWSPLSKGAQQEREWITKVQRYVQGREVARGRKKLVSKSPKGKSADWDSKWPLWPVMAQESSPVRMIQSETLFFLCISDIEGDPLGESKIWRSMWKGSWKIQPPDSSLW
jgi:hypothetical protein